jgi:hypothetical protein
MSNNDTLLFQHIISDSACRTWLAETETITKLYCIEHTIDYQQIESNVGGFPGKGHWAVPYLIRQFMDRGYEKIIYLDADCVIMDTSVDLREAVVKEKIGAVWHNLSYNVPDWSHFNVGALYVSNTMRVRQFVNHWLARAPGTADFPWWEQGIFNKLGTKMGIIEHLDNKWNAGHVSPSDRPIVMGLHGIPDRIGAIKEAVTRSV